MARILVIEDNNDIHAILTSLFEKEHEVYSNAREQKGWLVFERENLIWSCWISCCLVEW